MKILAVFFSASILLSFSACKKEDVVRDVAGKYIVSGSRYSNETNIHAPMQNVSLRISRSIRSTINLKIEDTKRDYLSTDEDSATYTFRLRPPMDCSQGDDIIHIGKQNDSIKGWINTDDGGYGFTGIRVD